MRTGAAALALLLLPGLAAPQAAPPQAARRPPELGAVVAQIERGDTAGAERQLRRMVASSGNAAARQLLARLLFDQHRDAEAIVELRKAALLGPLPRDLGLRLATAEIADGHPALAEQQLRAVATRYKSVQALLELARLQTRQKNAAAALVSLREARSLAPNSEDVLNAFAQVSLSLRAPVPALQVLEPLARMCPTTGQYQYMLGVGLMQVGDIESSVAPLREADRLEPDRPSTLIALGLVLNTQRLYGDAKPHLLRALDLEPDNVDGVAALAESEEGLGELEAAETHALRALARAGDHAIGNLALGMVRMKQERYEEACAALEKALAADPASPKAPYQLSLAWARRGDEAQSKKYLEIYRQRVQSIDTRLAEVRAKTGISGGGMQR
ncbi:MAG: tetratricopeptide repeat protein [Betaproteobacteria bacterium]